MKFLNSSRGKSRVYVVLGLKSVTANCDCKYGNSGFCSHVCAVFYRLASYQLLKYDYIPDSDFSSTVGPCSWKAPKPTNMVNLSANEMTWTVHKLPSSSSSTNIRSSSHSKGPVYQACASNLRDPPSTELMNHFKDRSSKLRLPFTVILDHALHQQHLALVETQFGSTYRISGLAQQQYVELDKEYTFFIDTGEQQSYPKDTNYPPFPLQPLPSLEELNLSHTDVWWPAEIILSIVECVSLEAQTTAQRANQSWRDAHMKRLSASQVGHILNRKREPSAAFLSNLFSSFAVTTASTTPRALQHGIENEEKALSEYKKAMLSKGFQVDVFPSGFVTHPDFFWLGATPDGKVRLRKGDKTFLGIVEIKCPYSARFLKPTESVVLKNFFFEKLDGVLKLKQDHIYYHQVQTQLFLTQAPWCDFVLFTFKGLSIQRIFPCKQWVLKCIPLLQNFYLKFAIPFVHDVPPDAQPPVFESESESEEDTSVVCTDISLYDDDDEQDVV